MNTRAREHASSSNHTPPSCTYRLINLHTFKSQFTDTYRNLWIKFMHKHAHQHKLTHSHTHADTKGRWGSDRTDCLFQSLQRAYWFFPHSSFYTPPSHSLASTLYFSFPPFPPCSCPFFSFLNLFFFSFTVSHWTFSESGQFLLLAIAAHQNNNLTVTLISENDLDFCITI